MKFGSFFSCKFSIVTASFVLFLFATGCMDNDENPAPQPVAYVNIYHASPDADDLAILINSEPIINTPFEYSDYTGYLPFYPGTRKLQFAEVSDVSQIALDTSIQLVNNKMYSVFIANSFPGIEAVVLGDSSEVPAEGNAMVRIVHLSPDAPAINILADDSNLFSELSFKDGTAFKEIASGTMTIKFQAVEGDSEVLLTVPAMKLDEKEYYTIVLKGFLNPPAGNENDIDAEVIRFR